MGERQHNQSSKTNAGWLFLLYINDIPSLIHFSKPFLFADDAKLLKIIKQLSDHSLLQQDLDQLHTWAIHNDLLFSKVSTSKRQPFTHLIQPYFLNYTLIVIWD